jgi:hypothetical protein
MADDPRVPYAFLQWKGTTACLDLHCLCGAHLHFDGMFAYAVRCAHCERAYRMPDTFQLVEDPTVGELDAVIAFDSDIDHSGSADG